MENDSEKTMYDLRVRVAERLRDTLHGRTVDMMQAVKPRLPHMLGFVDIGEVVDPNMIDGTLIDPNHEFWDDYYVDVRTRNASKDELITSIDSLKETDHFRMVYPHGEDAGIVYVEVDCPDETGEGVLEEQFTTTCSECNSSLLAAPSLVLHEDSYYVKASITCDECEYSQEFGRRLTRQ